MYFCKIFESRCTIVRMYISTNVPCIERVYLSYNVQLLNVLEYLCTIVKLYLSTNVLL